MKSNSFINLLSSEIDRATTSMNNQTASMKNILERSSNILIQMDDFLKSKEKTNENDIVYNFKKETIQNLVKIAVNYSKIINLKRNGDSVPLEHIHRSDDFRNFQTNVSNKKEILVSAIRRLQALKDNARQIQNDLNLINELELIASDTEDENESSSQEVNSSI